MIGLDHTPAGEPTVREALDRYFAENGFGSGGYEDRWVEFVAGPLRFRIPNTAARVAAVKLHDLHHVATGFETTWTGEGEMGAWEIAGGCGAHLAAWILNLQAVAIACLISPARVLRAFALGRRGRTLYHGERAEDWLDRPVEELRSALVRPDASPPTPLRALPSFLFWASIAMLTLAATAGATLLPLLLPALFVRWLAQA